MDHSPLGALPAEMRNDIYHLTFTNAEPVRLQLHTVETGGYHLKLAGERDKNVLALLATCKQAMKEAEPIAWDQVRFEIHASADDAQFALEMFARKMRKDTKALLPEATVVLEEDPRRRSGPASSRVPRECLLAIWKFACANAFKRLSVRFTVLIAEGKTPYELKLDLTDLRAFEASIRVCDTDATAFQNAPHLHDLQQFIASKTDSYVDASRELLKVFSAILNLVEYTQHRIAMAETLVRELSESSRASAQ